LQGFIAGGNPDPPNLMDGMYSEGDSAKSFQQALKAWRGGGGNESEDIEIDKKNVHTIRPRETRHHHHSTEVNGQKIWIS